MLLCRTLKPNEKFSGVKATSNGLRQQSFARRAEIKVSCDSMAYGRRTETKEERKRTRTTKRYTSNRLKFVEEVPPQILFLDTKPFVISTDELFQVDAYF